MPKYENPSPVEAWDRLSSTFSYLNRFPSAKRFLKLVELNGEYVPSPEYPIYFVRLTQIMDQPVETGFTIDKANVESCSAIIIMNHETELQAIGASGCKYHKGRLLSENGWDIGMFEKKNNPGSRDPKVVGEEIKAYSKIIDMNMGKPPYISPSFSPNNDEIIMPDLKDLGYDDIKWRVAIDKLSVPMQRQLFFQILYNYSNLNYTLYKAGLYITDIIKHGKGVWTKFSEEGKPTIVLSDFGSIVKILTNDENKPSTVLSECIKILTEKDEPDSVLDEDVSFLEMFPFIQVDTHARTISTNDPVIASINKNGFSLTDLLTSYYQNKFNPLDSDNPVYDLYKMLSDNIKIDLSVEIPNQPLSLKLVIADICANPEKVYKKTYLLELSSRTGLSLTTLLEELMKLK